ncbi:MAG TPA: allophanate hydrolase [Candidatus Sulfopaludibacter sp.]|jgi:allophanate hydrolase|nr:allophanate hydrolase [Candidatus Sulfopaludibacter sp.]
MTPNFALNLGALRDLYRSREARPSDVVAEVYRRIAAGPLEPVWISLVPREVAIARARKLEADSLAAAKPLFGVPFAVKDNIDVAGVATTAGCPAYAYQPAGNATVVQALVDAGAIPIGKTNLDQFATGLVGTRSPYGACSSVFDKDYISGGSSAGSAVAVASNLVSFALGSDTAGSGRVPAAFNNLVGLKPTRGVLSSLGLVPACRTLDCVSVFTKTCHDAHTVLQAARGFDPLDGFSRVPLPGQDAAPWLGGVFRFGVPAASQLEFFGDAEAAELYRKAVASLQAMGGEKVEIDFAPFRAAADLLYAGPWVAERLAEIGSFLSKKGAEMDPTVRGIIAGGERHSAVDTFKAMYRLADLRRVTEAEWRRMDVLVLPTTGTIYRHSEIAADPVRLNTNLGYYTNFVNLLDLAAVAVPAGFRTNGLPFGISLIGPAFSDEALLWLAGRYHVAPGPAVELERTPPGCVAVAVVGAHLSGEQLNWQLTERGARRIKTCRTAPNYRLYALDRTVPPKPGLVRDLTFAGPGIEVEVWAMPEDRFGSFVAAIPPPLGIGSVTLDDGEAVKCFICEPCAIAGATEITRFGGWRGYLSHAASVR